MMTQLQLEEDCVRAKDVAHKTKMQLYNLTRSIQNGNVLRVHLGR
jgi:hypothetical protein